MRFRSEREQELAAKVTRQMITLVESLLQRMVPIQTEAELQGSEAGRFWMVEGVGSGWWLELGG